ncbi:MAG: hypothetical protein SV186_04855 [Candidatus Nanohaloarchaea archaeon]|nr:hypothetical protein [Candidatus Nanohaloarchaea archaeon]
MRDRDDTTETRTETMPGHDPDNPDAPRDPVTEDDTFEEHIVRRLGERGGDTVEEIHRKTDFDRMTVDEDIVTYQVCKCGETLTDPEERKRCVECEKVACKECRIYIEKENLCPDCADDEWGIGRTAYITLYLLHKQAVTLSDLIGVEVFGNDPVDVQLDGALLTLLDEGLIQDDGGNGPAVASAGDSPLTNEGRQTLHVCNELYGDDPDIQELKEQVPILKAANGGR